MSTNYFQLRIAAFCEDPAPSNAAAPPLQNLEQTKEVDAPNLGMSLLCVPHKISSEKSAAQN